MVIFPDCFSQALKYALKFEGGYSDNPRDHGGATLQGVTQRTYNIYRRKIGEEIRPVKGMEASELQQIYYFGYWLAAGCDKAMPHSTNLAILMFDFAVNSGPKRAIEFLQSQLKVAVDGDLGPQTISALYKYPNAQDLCAKYLEGRGRFLRAIAVGDQVIFKRGWQNRVNALGQMLIPDWANIVF